MPTLDWTARSRVLSATAPDEALAPVPAATLFAGELAELAIGVDEAPPAGLWAPSPHLARLRLPADLAAALAEGLRELEPGRELRVELARGWAVYWKLREAGPRFLLAHPESGLWVSTFALTPELRDGYAAALAAPGPGGRLSALVAPDAASNLDLETTVEAPGGRRA